MAVTLVDTPPDEVARGTATVASMAMDWARRAPNQVAMREKDLGIWQEYTWERTWNLVLDAANGLLALGVEPGDRVLVLDFGEMISMGPPGEVQRDPAVIAAYLGDEAGFAAATE
ncbi:MAG: hypothetical protein DSY73_04035 [Actinobacteria bacterium]|nr:MAG: hypothetical protein DSY73_04035 [Actinomycetota bacterium]